MKTNYTLEDIKILLQENRFEELNYAINLIKKNQDRNIEDLEILDYLSKSEQIHPESREELNKLKEETQNEIIKEVEQSEETTNISVPIVETSEINDAFIEGAVAGAIAGISAAQNEEQLVEEPEIIEEYPKSELDKNELASDISEAAFINNLYNKGLTVKEFKTGDEMPYITFQMNNESKPYLDNLMKQLYDNRDPGIGYNLTKIGATEEEMFTIYLNDSTMPLEKLSERTSEMINSIENIVNDTDSEKDYMENMPDNIKNLKQQFVQDAPDVPTNENYRIGYINSDGVDNFYIMAGSKEDAIRLTEDLGYKSREYVGNGVVKVDTYGQNMDDTKLEESSENINDMDDGQAQYVRTEEKAKIKTIGVMPNKNNAYIDFKSVALVIILIIIVMILVYVIG